MGKLNRLFERELNHIEEKRGYASLLRTMRFANSDYSAVGSYLPHVFKQFEATHTCPALGEEYAIAIIGAFEIKTHSESVKASVKYRVADNAVEELNACLRAAGNLGLALSSAVSNDGALQYVKPGTNEVVDIAEMFQRIRTELLYTYHHPHSVPSGQQIADMEFIDKFNDKYRYLESNVIGTMIHSGRPEQYVLEIPINPLTEFLSIAEDMLSLHFEVSTEHNQNETD